MKKIVSVISTLFIACPLFAAGVHETPAMKALSRKAAVIEALEVSPTIGGINPDVFAYVIEGVVEAGTNPCDAEGRKVSIHKKLVGGDLHVFALLTKAPGEERRICTLEYDPVLVPFEYTVRGYRSKVDQVVIVNVNRPGSYETINP
jgi:hypothetical protein